jgi:pimeloyl-ACP methyl ester carboxylesterase
MGRPEVIGTVRQLRRRCSGAVLAFVCTVLPACGGDNQELAGPEPPNPPPPQDEGITPTAGCTDGVLEHGALYRICFPEDWNGDLVLYAHGYVPPGSALALPSDDVGGQSVSATVNSLGYAYATTSYRANGLVGPEATDDVVELAATVRRLYRPDPGRALVVGVSEGGLVATLAAERHPDLFDGALAACGPIGSFRRQLDYFVDFRVVFDYLFPGVIPGTPVDVPAEVAAEWESRYAPAVVVALLADPSAARELVRITGAPTERDDVVAIAVTAVGILWYNVFGSENAQQRLGGQPYDNSARVYSGSSDDAALNAGVARFTAEPAGLAGVAEFETTGNLEVPLVTLHTTGDPIVPVEQQALYGPKVAQAGATTHLTGTTVDRYGHCTFQAAELLGSFSTLLDKVGRPAASLADLSSGR